MFIDIHCHAGLAEGLSRPNGSRHPRPEELIEMLDGGGISRAVLLSDANPECRYAFATPQEVLQVCQQHPDRLIPFCNLDPRMLTNSPEADFGPMLEYFKTRGARGVGEYCPNLPFDDQLNMNLFRQVGQAGLPLTFHVAPRIGGCYGCCDELGLPRLEKVLQACPDLILLGHSQPFWSEISADVTEETRNTYPQGKVTPGRLVELMRQYPNLHGDLSAGSGLNAIRRDPEFGYEFLEEFQDRLYFGTDICNTPQELPQVDYFNRLKEERLISQEAWEKICWRNASSLLRVESSALRPAEQ